MKSDLGLLRKTKIMLIGSLIILATISVIIIVTSIENNIYYLTSLFIIAPLYYLLYCKYIKYIRLKKLNKLREDWGQVVKRKRNFKNIKLLFDKISSGKDISSDKSTVIDDETWQDLNLDQIYTRLDSTLTSPGENVLYDILRNPLFNNEEIAKRNKLINEFQHKKKFREKVGLELFKLDRQNDNSLVELLWDETLQPSHYGYLLNLLAVIPLILIGSYYFIGITSLLLLILMTVINVTVIHFFKKKHFNKLPIFSIKYLSSLIKTADNINSIENPILQEYQKELKPLLKKTRKLSKKISIIIPKTVRSDADLIFDYLNNLFLIEIRSFNSSLYDIKENIKELKKIYRLVGKIDSLLSIASYRESLTYYCLPEFVKGREDRELEIEDVYHPLLKKPVSNSIKLNNTGVIITGSNMAGKSTFLRTIGINVLMAQTISTCLAGSYKSSMMKVVTSISKTDNILEGKSFYFAEAERLLKLVNSIKGDFPALCIIDELLSGTNSVERLYASEGILDYLFKNNVLTMVATHDLDLADRLKDRYDCYHFNDNVSKYGLDFDYILKRGNALTFNAIKLLEYLNYPEEITDRARIKKSY